MGRAPLVLLAVAFAVTPCVSRAADGVVVEEITPGGAAEGAGVEVSDVLLSWRRAPNLAHPQPASGEILTPFDLWIAEIEQAPRGFVTIVGRRRDVEFSRELAPGKWALRVHPSLIGEALERYRIAVRQIETKEERAAGVAVLRDLAAGSRRRDPALSASLWFTTGQLLVEDGAWEQSQEFFEGAVEVVASSTKNEHDTAQLGALRHLQGNLLARQNRYDEASRAYLLALEVWEEREAESLSLAATLTSLGTVALDRSEHEQAEQYLDRAIGIRRQLAPDTLPVADTLNELGRLAYARGDLASAKAYHRQSLEIREELAPGTRTVVGSLGNLGIMSWAEGDLATASARFEEALAIVERVSPESQELAQLLGNLGIVARSRNDLAAAENFQRRSVRLLERLAPESLYHATAVTNLGVVAWYRWDLASAEEYFRRSLEIRERLAPESLAVATSVHDLGEVARQRGNLSEANALLTRAFNIRERLAPGSLDVALSLRSLANVARLEEDFSAAETYQCSALAIREKLAPSSLLVAENLQSLGELSAEQGELETAETLLVRALSIRERLSPESWAEAESAAALARLHRRREKPEQALALLRRSVQALETQEGKLGGIAEDRTVFRSRNMDTYRELIDLLVELGREQDAFHVVERSRARGLLAMLAERDMVLTADVPTELERQRRLLAAEYDRLQRPLSTLSPEQDGEEIERILAKLESLNRRRAEIREDIRAQSPRLAALRYAEPLDTTGVRRALGPGTALLSYSVSESKTHLFVFGAEGNMRVETLPFGEAALRDEVSRFRAAIETEPTDPELAGDVHRRGERLYRFLVAPAASALQNAKRLLIVPDGPLHTLPFAALVRTDRAAARSGGQYLVESMPLHVVVSMTVYDELRRRSMQRASASSERETLVAFGDPAYPKGTGSVGDSDTASDPVMRSLTRGNFFAPLPATREEVQTIAALFGRDATALLGEKATEERAKEIGVGTRLIHFAAHGLFDERVPLNSAIALSIPKSTQGGRDNGLLQAWEVFEGMRIDADLVTLSACQSALGSELAGEGIVGLTRAFHYAGARSVLASLWGVADQSTAHLMSRFYRYLEEGMSKDEALRTAQLDLIRAPPEAEPSSPLVERSIGGLSPRGDALGVNRSAPFYWAAFVLSGDWR